MSRSIVFMYGLKCRFDIVVALGPSSSVLLKLAAWQRG